MKVHKYEDGTEPKVGDLIIATERGMHCNYEKGATAQVTSIDKYYVYLKWDKDNPKRNGQHDGGYAGIRGFKKRGPIRWREMLGKK